MTDDGRLSTPAPAGSGVGGTGAAPRAVVVGSLNADLVTEVPRIPLPGQTLRASGLRRFTGGKGANQAVALARLGASVEMVGAVGDDAEGRAVRAELSRAGVSTRHVAVRPEAATGLAVVMVDEAGDNAIVVVPGANGQLVPGALPAASAAPLADADVLLTQLETPLPTVRSALRGGVDAGMLTVLNAAPAQPLPDELLSLVDILVVNEHEVRELSGCAEPVAGARRLREHGAGVVVVTLGPAGAILTDSDESVTVEGFSVSPVDTTGAGDCFVGALALALAQRWPPVAAMHFANAAAAVSVTRVGAQSAMPTRDEVVKFLADHPSAGH